MIGAVHLALGQDVSRRFVLDLLRPLLDSDEFLEAGYDFKSRLQEIAAAEGENVTYALSESGLEHQKVYTATVTVPGIVTARGDGASKKDAELAAAQNAVRGLLAERGRLIPRGRPGARAARRSRRSAASSPAPRPYHHRVELPSPPAPTGRGRTVARGPRAPAHRRGAAREVPVAPAEPGGPRPGSADGAPRAERAVADETLRRAAPSVPPRARSDPMRTAAPCT